jgi:hypothetical protein
LRNLEIRDLSKSSLDTVLLGDPHLVFLPAGVVQVQSLYEGSRGPGAARLIGVTAFVNGRAGLGPDIESAVRQALNKPPRIHVSRPAGPVVVGRRVQLSFTVENARRAVVTITTTAGSRRVRLGLEKGTGTVVWVPTAAGAAHVHVVVEGLDGTWVSGSTAFRVVSRPPTIRVIDPPTRAVVGHRLRVSFKVADAVAARAEVSTRDGVVVSRRYLIRHGIGVFEWTPSSVGRVLLRIRVQGRQGQTATKALHIVVTPGHGGPAPPSLTLLQVPKAVKVGHSAEIAFRADGCRNADARIEGRNGEVSVWRFECPARMATFVWRPKTPGRYQLTATARGVGVTAQETTELTAEPTS